MIMKVTISLFANTMMIMVMSYGYPNSITLINIVRQETVGRIFFFLAIVHLSQATNLNIRGGRGRNEDGRIGKQGQYEIELVWSV